jgi:hypothetical protein
VNYRDIDRPQLAAYGAAFDAWFFHASDAELDQLQAYLEDTRRCVPLRRSMVEALSDERSRQRMPPALVQQLLSAVPARHTSRPR